jgi:type I restriction enzyme S subunit
MKKLAGRTPEIRFSGFNELWQHTELNNLLKESKKKNKDLEYSKEEVLSVSGEFGVVNQIEHLGRSYAGESVHNYGIVEVGEIVYTKSPLKANPYGIIKLNRGKVGIVSTLYAIYKTIPSKADGVFLDQYFSSDTNTNRYLRPLVKKGAKNDMKINNDYVLHDRIFVPTLPEQQKIASFLREVDNKLQALKHKKELLEQYKKGIMQKLFSQALRFKDENGQPYPNWGKKKLGEVGTITMGQSPESKAYNNESNGILLIQGNADINERKTKPRNWTTQITKTCDIGDLILTVRAPVGSIAKSLHKACIGRGVCSIVNKRNSNLEFIYQFLLAFEPKWVRLEQGSTFTAISGNDIKSILIEFPSLPEQTKIANFLTAIDQKIEQASQQIAKAETWKKGLLQKMFV